MYEATLAGLLSSLRVQWEGAGQWLYYQTIFDFIDGEIRTFQSNLLDAMLRWVGGVALTAVLLWLLWQGYRILQGQARNPMEQVVSGAWAALIATAATTLTLFHTDLYALLSDSVPREIARAMTGKDRPALAMVEDSFNAMAGVMIGIDALNVAAGSSENLKTDVDRVAWLAGMGVMGPATVGGALLMMYRVALALFVGLAPLFTLCLLYQPTRSLFHKWLLYGIGTMFAQAALVFMAGVAKAIVVSVAAVAAAQYAAAAATGLNPVSVSSMAMLQGGVGLIMTLLLVAIPPMVAYFFQGTLGQFMAYSVFGPAGGARRWEKSTPAPAAPSSTMEAPPHQREPAWEYARRTLPSQNTRAGEANYRLESGEVFGSFRERHPNALASNTLIGRGEPIPFGLPAEARAALPPPVDMGLAGLGERQAPPAPSGRSWVAKFPTSTDTASLTSPFRENVESFASALRDAGATVAIAATVRPPERAYLMHWSWKIVNGMADPKEIPDRDGVDIRWAHLDAAGNYDREASIAAAREMVNGYAIQNLRVAPALNSRHIEGNAIDMSITWNGTLSVNDAFGNVVRINSEPRTGMNSALHNVGSGYGVQKFHGGETDKPHWSNDGR